MLAGTVGERRIHMKALIAVAVLGAGLFFLWDVFEHRARVQTADTELSRLREEIIRVEQANSALKVDAAVLKNKVADLEQQRREAQSRENRLKSDEAQLLRDCEALRERIKQQESFIVKLKEEKKQETAGVERKAEAVQKKVDNTLAKDRLTLCEGKLKQVKKDQEDAKRRLKIYEANISYARHRANKNEERDLLERMNSVRGDLERFENEIINLEEQILTTKGEIMKTDPDFLNPKLVKEQVKKPEMWYVDENGVRRRVEGGKIE
jgi:chromosome segregation ATPase